MKKVMEQEKELVLETAVETANAVVGGQTEAVVTAKKPKKSFLFNIRKYGGAYFMILPSIILIILFSKK